MRQAERYSYTRYRLFGQQQQKNDNDDIFMIPLPLSIYEARRSRGAVLGGGWWKGGEM